MIRHHQPDVGSTRPTHPRTAAVLCEVKQARIPNKRQRAYAGLPRRRRMPAKKRVILPTAAIEQRSSSHLVDRLASREQGFPDRKNTFVGFDFGNRRLWQLIRARGDRREQRQEQGEGSYDFHG